MTLDPKKLEAAKFEFRLSAPEMREAADVTVENRTINILYAYGVPGLEEEITALKAELARFEWRPSMKPESIKLVAKALKDSASKYRIDSKLTTIHEHQAQAAIRAVMQTDEVRELVEAAGNVVAWCEKLDLLRPDAAKLKRALSQLEASHD